MKTDDLIKALAADAKSVEPPISHTFAVAVGIGALLSLAAFLATLGMRADVAQAAATSIRFLFKFVVTLSLAIPAFFLVRGLARPDFKIGKRLRWLALGPALLIGALAAEMMSVPADDWHARMIGHNSFYCMITIPLLSLAPFAAILYALKCGAPAKPAVAGAVGGILSAAIAATLYASHCADDSPMFVMAWYPVGFVLMATLGAIIGSRYLRW